MDEAGQCRFGIGDRLGLVAQLRPDRIKAGQFLVEYRHGPFYHRD